jgi:glutamate-ammonia-ligase adenylyltransferase
MVPGMTMISRITRTPLAFDPDAAADLAAGFTDLPPELRGLMAATAGCSPYLKGLMEREAEWLREVAGQAPEAALEAVLAAADVPVDQLGAALRQAKRRVALLAGLCDLGGVWPLEAVTGALTRLADLAVHLCLTRLVAEEIRRGKLPGQSADDAATAGGMVALAMGKMGAGELN